MCGKKPHKTTDTPKLAHIDERERERERERAAWEVKMKKKIMKRR